MEAARFYLGALVKALFLASIAVVGLFGASALASDLPTKAPVNRTPITAPPYNWSGFYVGANFGGTWTNGSLNIPTSNFYGGITELIGGVQAGYNFQAGHLLLGVEGDFDWASFNHPTLPVPTLGSVSHHWMSTVAGRVGLVNDRWLVFAKLGGGWVQSDAIVNLPGSPSWTGSSTNGGWLIGGGIEYGFGPCRPRWSAITPAAGIASTAFRTRFRKMRSISSRSASTSGRPGPTVDREGDPLRNLGPGQATRPDPPGPDVTGLRSGKRAYSLKVPASAVIRSASRRISSRARALFEPAPRHPPFRLSLQHRERRRAPG